MISGAIQISNHDKSGEYHPKSTYESGLGILINWLMFWNIFYFSINLGNVIIPVDEPIFFRGVCPTTNQLTSSPSNPSPPGHLWKKRSLKTVLRSSHWPFGWWLDWRAEKSFFFSSTKVKRLTETNICTQLIWNSTPRLFPSFLDDPKVSVLFRWYSKGDWGKSKRLSSAAIRGGKTRSRKTLRSCCLRWNKRPARETSISIL